MPELRVHNMSISLDSYIAGPDQGPDAPLGVDNNFVQRGDAGIGATIMGRNMFGPQRGEWGDSDWSGWWGDTPPFGHPVFVVTHHRRESIPMKGGTTFAQLHLAIVPVLLGSGERLFDGLGARWPAARSPSPCRRRSPSSCRRRR